MCFSHQNSIILLCHPVHLRWVEGRLSNTEIFLIHITQIIWCYCHVTEFKIQREYCLICLVFCGVWFWVFFSHIYFSFPLIEKKEVHTFILSGSNSMCHVPLRKFSLWGVGYLNECTYEVHNNFLLKLSQQSLFASFTICTILLFFSYVIYVVAGF